MVNADLTSFETCAKEVEQYVEPVCRVIIKEDIVSMSRLLPRERGESSGLLHLLHKLAFTYQTEAPLA